MSVLGQLPKQHFSTFPGLRSFNTAPHARVTPTIQLFLRLFHSSNFATVMTSYVNTGYLICEPVRVMINRLGTTALESQDG